MALSQLLQASQSQNNENFSSTDSTQSTYQDNSKYDTSTKTLTEEKAKDKSGFKLGLQMDFGENSLYQRSFFPSNNTGDNSGEPTNSSMNKSFFAFSGGITLGYQHYFNKEALGVKQAFGIDFNAFIGGGIPLQEDFTIWEFGRVSSLTLQNEFIPIRASFDLNFLWDFFEKGSHTIGLDLGVGYSMGYYINIKSSKNILSNGQPHPEELGIKVGNQIINSFYPQIGLHYYYGRNQFSIKYRFGLSYSSGVETNDFFVFGKFDTSVTDTNHLSINYSYRF